MFFEYTISIHNSLPAHTNKWLLCNENQVLNAGVTDLLFTNINYRQICFEKDNKYNFKGLKFPPHYTNFSLKLPFQNKSDAKIYNIPFNTYFLLQNDHCDHTTHIRKFFILITYILT